MSKFQIKTKDLFNCEIDYLKPLFKNSVYPWDILPKIKELSFLLIKKGIKGYKRIKPDVLIGKNVKIAKTATIIGPTIIGDNTEVRPGAFIRGDVFVGRNCVVGNSTELKNCILLDHVQVPHYNYVGDSILANYAHLGCGAICSNLRNDGKNVVIRADKKYETGLRKIGAFVGEHAQIGCNSVLNPGSIIEKDANMWPLTMHRGYFKKK